MQKRFLLILFFLMSPLCSLFSIGIETSVVSVDIHPDFWAGLFPSSVTYMVSVADLNFLPPANTSLGLQLSTGTEARKFTNDPISGTHFKSLSETEEEYLKYLIEHPDYDTMYALWNLGLTQGFFRAPNEKQDLITLSLNFTGHWEVALNPILQTGNRTGYPFNLDIFTDIQNQQQFYGTPDLAGDRQLLDMGFSFSGKINDKIHKTANDSGIYVEFEAIWMPKVFNLTSKRAGKSDYFKFWAYTSLSLMLFSKKDNDENIFGFGVTTDIEFRYLYGNSIPKYAEQLKATTWYYEPENTEYLIRNTTKFYYYGQQFFKSWVPKAYIFFDFSHTWGKNNNTPQLSYSNTWTGSAGLHIELEVFNTFSIYYEIGKLFLYTGSNPEYFKGFFSSETLKLGVSIKI